MDSNTITTGQLVEAGNKAIVNNGDIRMFGKNRSRMSRLTAEANKGDTKVYVEKGLDWAAGELLGFAPTGMNYRQSEQGIIKSYNSVTGELVLEAALQYYHFGAAVSTGANYQGLDMRGEVMMLNRNILIQGDQTKSDWSG